jgi:hypothetical protein
LDPATVTDIANYSIDNDIAVKEAVLRDSEDLDTTDGRTVVLTTTAVDQGDWYKVTVKNVADEFGNVIGTKEEEISNLTQEEEEILKDNHLVTQLYFDYSRHMRYSKDFENYQHGIMSAFLLFRKLTVFNNRPFSYSDYKTLRVNKFDYVKTNVLAEILTAITDHESEGFQMNEIVSDSSFLTFIDELEEFSRISRANQNRQYINEFCKSSIYVEDGYFNIDFIFDNTQIDNLDPEKAFKGRCTKPSQPGVPYSVIYTMRAV